MRTANRWRPFGRRAFSSAAHPFPVMRRLNRKELQLCSAALVCAGFVASCTPTVYQTRADRETYGILYQKTAAVENVSPSDTDIEPPAPVAFDDLVSEGGSPGYLGRVGSLESGAKVLPLDKALHTSVTHGRAYLDEKEEVFLDALDLTLARFRLQPMFNGGGELEWASDSRSARLQQGMTELVADNTFARSANGGFNWLYRTGARVSADFTRDFLRFTTGNRSVNQSALAVSVVQPMLQGGGTLVTLEALTQEERNLLYSLRDFADFRRFFVVAIVSDYYAVLQARDRVRNNYAAYQGFLKNLERDEALAEEDRRTQTELGLLRQAALQAESRWINAIQDYESQLDSFKIRIGVPVDERLILEQSELQQLRIEDPDVTREQAVEIALVSRPDLQNSKDRVEDAARQVKVAENGLLPGVDISMDYQTLSDPGDTTPSINWDRRRWEGAVDLDLPLDRKAERNIYRASLVFLQRAERADELARDTAKFEIYEQWRAIEQAKLNYRIAEQQVELAQRRLEEQLLLDELGKGEARDLIDAQTDLLDAQNQRTSTVVDHFLARLRLWRDMGILYVSEDGSWAKALRNESR